ncbi:hypothetical protein SISNIDRAFT_173430 [Sistotremastrum niveocremeum HHB9708]|uniref:Uncharacterized protein n=2 Tax=Sistotremastraceae TaxID=3402574 RepID=A0A164RV61_9AGAM|nr:hypothetical protein SISNIDRAFT_173430 [Sistotremastrum niveocremeum HHB9708]KZT38724.1 hypothetical protein SISSUDRAFT_719604 [Sistotremastrum suecicum HHB10207 ss-3]
MSRNGSNASYRGFRPDNNDTHEFIAVTDNIGGGQTQHYAQPNMQRSSGVQAEESEASSVSEMPSGDSSHRRAELKARRKLTEAKARLHARVQERSGRRLHGHAENINYLVTAAKQDSEQMQLLRRENATLKNDIIELRRKYDTLKQQVVPSVRKNRSDMPRQPNSVGLPREHEWQATESQTASRMAR